jgi:hypothetical protein
LSAEYQPDTESDDGEGQQYGYNEHTDSWETCEGAFFPCEKHVTHKRYREPPQGSLPTNERHLK